MIMLCSVSICHTERERVRDYSRCDIKLIKQVCFAEIEHFKEGKRTEVKSTSSISMASPVSFFSLFGVCARYNACLCLCVRVRVFPHLHGVEILLWWILAVSLFYGMERIPHHVAAVVCSNTHTHTNTHTDLYALSLKTSVIPDTYTTQWSGSWDLQPHLSLGGRHQSNQPPAFLTSIIHDQHWVVVIQQTQSHSMMP